MVTYILKKYLKRAKSVSLLAFCAFAFCSCELAGVLLNEVRNYDPNDHPLIEKGDTLIFESSTGADTLLVKESKVYASRELDEEADFDQYIAKMTSTHCVDSTCVEFGIRINKHYYTVESQFLYYNGWRYYTQASAWLLISNRRYSYTIGDYKLKKLHNVQLGESLEIFKPVESAYYSKTYGFIQYVNYAGEEFVLS